MSTFLLYQSVPRQAGRYSKAIATTSRRYTHRICQAIEEIRSSTKKPVRQILLFIFLKL
jgi:hypothetical protein